MNGFGLNFLQYWCQIILCLLSLVPSNMHAAISIEKLITELKSDNLVTIRQAANKIKDVPATHLDLVVGMAVEILRKNDLDNILNFGNDPVAIHDHLDQILWTRQSIFQMLHRVAPTSLLVLKYLIKNEVQLGVATDSHGMKYLENAVRKDPGILEPFLKSNEPRVKFIAAFLLTKIVILKDLYTQVLSPLLPKLNILNNILNSYDVVLLAKELQGRPEAPLMKEDLLKIASAFQLKNKDWARLGNNLIWALAFVSQKDPRVTQVLQSIYWKMKNSGKNFDEESTLIALKLRFCILVSPQIALWVLSIWIILVEKVILTI